ncbi:hypothetical protein LV779_31820 [Streptomyces thinghirensis]|nr:hypothetical protein [Streptomyces thinghirensis]
MEPAMTIPSSRAGPTGRLPKQRPVMDSPFALASWPPHVAGGAGQEGPLNSELLSPLAPEDGHDWRVLSTKEVRQQSSKLTATIDAVDVETPAGDPENLDPDTPVAIRAWEPDPEDSMLANSPVLPSLQLLDELRLLNSAVKAIARTRPSGWRTGPRSASGVPVHHQEQSRKLDADQLAAVAASGWSRRRCDTHRQSGAQRRGTRPS